MSPLNKIHLSLLIFWMTLVAVETWFEFHSRKGENLAKAAKAHFWIDMLLELPTALGVLITGILLLQKVPVISNILLIKIGLGLVAIAANLYCVIPVVLRYKYVNDPAKLEILSRKIRWMWIWVPTGLGAFYLGLRYITFIK